MAVFSSIPSLADDSIDTVLAYAKEMHIKAHKTSLKKWSDRTEAAWAEILRRAPLQNVPTQSEIIAGLLEYRHPVYVFGDVMAVAKLRGANPPLRIEEISALVHKLWDNGHYEELLKLVDTKSIQEEVRVILDECVFPRPFSGEQIVHGKYRIKFFAELHERFDLKIAVNAWAKSSGIDAWLIYGLIGFALAGIPLDLDIREAGIFACLHARWLGAEDSLRYAGILARGRESHSLQGPEIRSVLFREIQSINRFADKPPSFGKFCEMYEPSIGR